MNRTFTLASLAAALSIGLALAGCDRNIEPPTASTDPASGVLGTPETETAGTIVTPSPDTTIQQNPSAAGGLSGPGGTTGNTTGTPGITPSEGMTGGTGTGIQGTGDGTVDGTVNSPTQGTTGTGGTAGTGGR